MSDERNTVDIGLDPDASRIRQRLRALRSRYPGMRLTSQLTHIHDDQVVIRAELSLPDGSTVSAHAAEPSDGAGMLDGAIELAEQRATIRALDLLGLGEVPAGPDRAEPRPAPIPQAEDEHAPPVVDALRKASQRRQTAERPPATIDEPATETAEPPSGRAAVPSERGQPQRVISAREGSDSESSRPDPEAEPQQAPAPEPQEAPVDEPDMADYTWTHFWTWARANNLSTKGQVEQRIGRPIDNLTPRDVRQLLHEQGVPQ